MPVHIYAICMRQVISLRMISAEHRKSGTLVITGPSTNERSLKSKFTLFSSLTSLLCKVATQGSEV